MMASMDTRPASDLGMPTSDTLTPTLDTLARRADVIVASRPLYQELVTFYLAVFRQQIQWRPRLVIDPDTGAPEQALACLREGAPLATRFSPGLEEDSLASLWSEMKDVFRRGNPALKEGVLTIDRAEEAGAMEPASWLASLRPHRPERVTEMAAAAGVDVAFLGTLARAVTAPHWSAVARRWLPRTRLTMWRRFQCPVCGGRAAIGELRTEKTGHDGMKAAPERYLHCAFCWSRWAAPSLQCPACDSTRAGDAKYYHTPDDPGTRIDFCASCKRYLKVVDGDRVGEPLHVGLEMLATLHLDQVALDKGLTPLDGAPRSAKEGG